MQIIIPLAGKSARFAAVGYKQPKYLLKLAGKTILELIINALPLTYKLILIKTKEQNLPLQDLDIQQKLTVVEIEAHDKGPVYTVMQARDALVANEKTAVHYCDFLFDFDYNRFNKVVEEDVDGAVACYTGFHPHMLINTSYAYVQVDDHENIFEIAEKRHFTDNPAQEWASNGFYYFKSAELLLHLCEVQLATGSKFGTESYISQLYEHLLMKNGKVKLLRTSTMAQLGTPQDYELYQYAWRSFHLLQEHVQDQLDSTALILPMAGIGERFKMELYSTAKALLPVNEVKMYQASLSCLPICDERYLVLNQILAHHEEFKGQEDTISIENAVGGQAISAGAGVRQVQPDKSVLIGAVDNGLPFKYKEAVEEFSRADAIIFLLQPNWQHRKRAESYGWFKLDTLGNAVDATIKKAPHNHEDGWALASGCFYFKSASCYMEWMHRLNQPRYFINEELYIDTLVEEMIRSGLVVCGTILPAGLLWGTPAEYESYLYHQLHFSQLKAHPYSSPSSSKYQLQVKQHHLKLTNYLHWN